MKKIIKYFLIMIMFFLFSSCVQENKLTISFYDDETLIQKINFSNENDVKLLNPGKDGYDFVGWFLDKDFKEPYNDSKLSEYFEKQSLSLYACWEKTMNFYMIKNYGLIDNKSVINPVFSWVSPYNEIFNIELKKGDQLVQSLQTKDFLFNCNKLDYNSTYSLTITGTHGLSQTLEFTTISDKGYNVNKNIVLDSQFANNMVLQRNEELEICGEACENTLISITFMNQLFYGITDENGKFKVNIGKYLACPDPQEMIISNNLTSSITISNILIGDVFFFTGQSNMQWGVENSDYLPQDVTNAKNNNVRFFSQDIVESTTKLDHVKNGKWFISDDYNYKQFSALAYMSGSILSTYLKNTYVPVGIITAYQGNTNIANWMSDEYYYGNCSTKHLHYNAMVYPLRNTKIKGVVWYQGENNSAAGGDYEELLLDYFDNYRNLFNNKDLPFYVIGLCCYDGDSGNNYDFSYVRESQAEACLKDDKAYFISTCDNGDPTFIHPKAKRYIAERVVKSILGSLYNYDFLTEGPSYKSHTINGNEVTISFNNAVGLKATGDIEIYLAGSDGKYYLADASIKNDQLICSSSNVANPVYIKYGFGKSPFVNIFNKDGFAITPFRTDEHNKNIDLLEYNDINKYTFHPDGSKMNISYANNGLQITKTNDGKTYGSVRLDKWGMINYDSIGFKLTVIGTNSNANIIFRAVEGPSYETWGYSFVDNFVGEKTFDLNLSDFKIILNKGDSQFDMQCVSYIEIVIEAPKDATLTVLEARFIDIERTKPIDFSVDSVKTTNNETTIILSKSTFAEEYYVEVSKDKEFKDIIKTFSGKDIIYKFDSSSLKYNTPYYVRAVAKNELGETKSTNDFVFYISDENSLIVQNFDFTSQEALDAYISSNMKVHTSLDCILDPNGVKIISNGGGWQNFIFVIESGSNAGMAKLMFDADFTNYKGTVVLEIVGTDWTIYDYQLDLSKQKSGTFTIDLSSYLDKNTKNSYNNQPLMWISFNFNDNIGNGYIIFDDCKLTK